MSIKPWYEPLVGLGIEVVVVDLIHVKSRPTAAGMVPP
jgi:hypothetical protein